MKTDPFEEWIQKTAEKNRTEKIPQHILEHLPKKVLAKVHAEQKMFYVRMFFLGLILLLGVALCTVIWNHWAILFPAEKLVAPVTQAWTVTEKDSISDEEIVTVLANIEEERLWQLGPEIYSNNFEVMDWVALGH